MADKSLLDVFLESQDSQNQHALVQAFKQIYSMVTHEDFWSEFTSLVRHPIAVYEREPAVENTIEFIAKAVTSIALQTNNQSDNAEPEDEEMHPLLLHFISFLIKHHSASDRGVRFRVCQLISKLLLYLGDGAQIDDNLYDSIHENMVERLRDKCPNVRIQAVLALSRLQDPSDENCAVTKAYMILMARDLCPNVRRIVLTTISLSKYSLPAIIDRTRDVKETVRKTAFSCIAEKVPFRALSIEQRIQLLHYCLNDRYEPVKNHCSNKLLQSWLKSCDGNVLTLLSRLDVQSSTETCEQALQVLFKNSSVLELVENFDIIDERALIDEDKVTCESAFYWRNIVHFIYSKGHEYDEQLDKVRPNCLEFCAYLERYCQKLINCTDVDEILDLEFIIHQLIKILALMDFSDQASHKQSVKLLHEMLLSEIIHASLIPFLFPCLKKLYTNVQSLINYLAETISEIREPITSVEKSLTKDERRNLDKKLASIRVKINELRNDLEQYVADQNFEKAAQMKAEISNLDVEKSALLEDEGPKIEEIRTQKNDPLTVLKCLTIICEMLTHLRIKDFSPPLQTLLDTQILPGMTSEEAEIRNVAIRAIGLCCLIKKDIIMQHLPLLLQASQMDTGLVRGTALKCIFDLIHVFGLEAFHVEGEETEIEESIETNGNQTDGNINEESNTSTQSIMTSSNFDTEKTSWNETASRVITILSSNLDNENLDLRRIAAQGLSKLLISGRLVSPKLLSHLILLWYNPIVEDEETLVQVLGSFFPLFAFSNSANQRLVEEAFMPTMKALLKAPKTSPLAEINEFNVALFLLELTETAFLVENQSTGSKVVTENPCHEALSIKICNEILSNPNSFDVRLWLRILCQLRLSTENLTLFKDLDNLCEEMSSVVVEKTCVKTLWKFTSFIKDLYAQCKETLDMEKENNQTLADGGDSSNNTQTPPRTQGNVEKTPVAPRSAAAVRARSTLRPTSKLESASPDDNVFLTPGPLKRTRLVDEEGRTRISENANVDSTIDGKSTPARTPKTPKRPLHTIQDPTFTG